MSTISAEVMGLPSMSMFSPANPKLQIAWDATSLYALMFCPTYYQRTIIEGWRLPGNVDLDFGVFFAGAVEVFKKARLSGAACNDAGVGAVEWVIKASGRYAEGEEEDHEQYQRSDEG